MAEEKSTSTKLDIRLTTHEAICTERWKTTFNQLEGIESRAATRFTRLEGQITRLEAIMIGVAATGLMAGGGLLWSILTMIPQ
jgi:hypothetical protein